MILKKQKPEHTKDALDFAFKVYSVKSANGGGTWIEGYANTPDKDRVGDVVLPKAFEKSLDEYMDNPVLLFQHNWDVVLGRVYDAKITDKGLWVKAKISEAKDVADHKLKIEEGSLQTFSIGYNEVDSVYNEQTKTKTIKELELLEISVVTIPANSKAKFTRVEESTDTEPEEVKDDAKSLNGGVEDSDPKANKAKGESSMNKKTETPEAQAGKTEEKGSDCPKKKDTGAEGESPVAQGGDQVASAPAEAGKEESKESKQDDYMAPVVELLKGIHDELKALRALKEESMKMGDYPKPKKDEEKGEEVSQESEEAKGEESEGTEEKKAKETETKSVEDMTEEEALAELEIVTKELQAVC